MPEREITQERETARRESELVATVSHELRTPLASVMGFVELLLDRELDEDTRRSYLQTVHREAQRLAGLIDDFLDLEKIEAGRFTLALESFELGALLQHEVALFAGQSENHELELVLPEEVLATVGDPNRIAQVVANLLSNAIKYSPAGGPVTITATPGEGFARVQVTDSGLGIPAAQQSRVFTKFFRVDSSDTRDIGGTGLGLALCQELVLAHGGRIGFATSEGAGSTFWFDLPTAWVRDAVKGASRVLVIEEDATLAAKIKDRLAFEGLEVVHVATGELGLERAVAEPPAVICLDADLSGDLDGWQVLARLKTNPATAYVPVVVCAAAKGRSTAATLGAAGFVLKPVTADQVGDAVKQCLAAERTSVLVVGGDRALRRLVVETLARDGGDLREAADGMEAISMIDARQPDALVLDLALPGRDGFGTIAQLLDRPETRGLPVVVLAGRDLSATEQRFLSERHASLLAKGAYSGDELCRLVQRGRGASGAPAILAGCEVFAADIQQESLTPESASPETLTAGHLPNRTRSHAE